MRPPSSSGDAPPARNPRQATPARQLDALHQGFRTRLQPVLAQAREAAERELRGMATGVPKGELAEAIANAVVLQHDAPRHERAWQQNLGRGFARWPTAPDAAVVAQGFSLVSEGELHAQLIGQPTIEALDRRFAEVLEIIEGRLWSLAAALGGRGRPSNPFGPRAVVDAFLDTYSAVDCDRLLRASLLRHYERLCGPCLTEAYAWLNAELAEGGHSMDGASAGNALVSQPVTGVGPASWPGHDALQPRSSSWRQHAEDHAGFDSGRRGRLRKRLGTPSDAADRQAVRDYTDQEFTSVLSLLQGNETPRTLVQVPGGIGEHLRGQLLAGAAGLGLSRDLAAPSPAQVDALAIVGALFDGLRAEAVLSPDAQARLARLAWPVLRLALADQALFDEPGHPALRLLDGIVECWDANPEGSEDEVELHALADRIADGVANDYHGESGVFANALGDLEAERTRLLRRAGIAERRAWQSVLGGERLQDARRDADARLAERLEGRMLLPEVADFLAGPWRLSLVMARLRDDAGTGRHAEALAMGDALLRIDAAAAHARGAEVAEGLIALEPGLRACFVADGSDGAAVDESVARLVAALARPDAPRAVAGFEPLADGDTGHAGAGATPGDTPPPVGQVLLEPGEGGGAPTWLRLAWTSPVTGRHLLVNRQGARHALLSPAGFSDALARGALRPRAPEGPVEAVLRRLADAPGG